jgi:hypothetical protein
MSDDTNKVEGAEVAEVEVADEAVDTRTAKELFIDSLIDNEKRLAIAIEEGKSAEEIRNTIGFDEAQVEIMTTRLASFDQEEVIDEAAKADEEAEVTPPAPAPETGLTGLGATPVTTEVDPSAQVTEEKPVTDETAKEGESVVTDEVAKPAEVTPEAPVSPGTPVQPVG